MKLIKFTLILSLLTGLFFMPQKSIAQISSGLVASLPDSLKPNNRNKLKLAEASKILMNFYFLNQKFTSDFEQIYQLIDRETKYSKNRAEKITGYFSIICHDIGKAKYGSSTENKIDKVIALIGNNHTGFEEILVKTDLYKSLFLIQRKEYESAI